MRAPGKALWLLMTHNADGTPSSTKLWQSVGYVVASWIMVYLALHGLMSCEYLLVYLGALTAARSFQHYLIAKGGGNPGPDK